MCARGVHAAVSGSILLAWDSTAHTNLDLPVDIWVLPHQATWRTKPLPSPHLWEQIILIPHCEAPQILETPPLTLLTACHHACIVEETLYYPRLIFPKTVVSSMKMLGCVKQMLRRFSLILELFQKKKGNSWCDFRRKIAMPENYRVCGFCFSQTGW